MQRGEIMPGKVQELGSGKGGALSAINTAEQVQERRAATCSG